MKIYKTFAIVGVALLGTTITAVAEPQGSAPSPTVNVQINTEFLNDLMRSAIIFNGMVQNLNLNKTLHDSGVARDGNATQMKHTAAVLGAGAGVGLAVGGMTGSQKGAMIGAVAGSAGAYMIDQIVQHQAAAKARANADTYRDNYRDNSQYNEREPLHFKERTPQQ